MTYWFGAMVRLRPTTEALSSASRLSALASSTGCTSLRKARAKTPFTARSMPFSKRSRTPTPSLPPVLARAGRSARVLLGRRHAGSQPNGGEGARLHRAPRANLYRLLARVAE